MAIYTVSQGDSLYSIARRFRTTAQRIATDNGIISPNIITVGQSLYIAEPEKVYTVLPGDTLGSIAEKFGVTENRLFRNNPGLMGKDNINAGETLVITLPPPAYDREIEVSGYAYPFIDRNTVRSVLPYLTYLPIFTYGINNDLSLIPTDDEELISLAKEYGAIPLMMIATLNADGYFDSGLAEKVLSTDENIEQFASSIADAVREKGYGGVEFDFEYIPAQYNEAYARLIGRTRELISPLLVFADLAPKESDTKQGLLYEGHNYRRIGEEADRMLLMTYEYGYTYGPSMAVAPVNLVRGVVEYATDVIPSQKLLLGVPNYGYDWTLPYVSGESKAQSLSNLTAIERAAEKSARIEFDTTAKAPYYNYYERTPEGPKQHEVWFEDPRSLEASFGLIEEYDLAGTGIWNILRPFPQLWLTLDSLYNIKKSDTR